MILSVICLCWTLAMLALFSVRIRPFVCWACGRRGCERCTASRLRGLACLLAVVAVCAQCGGCVSGGRIDGPATLRATKAAVSLICLAAGPVLSALPDATPVRIDRAGHVEVDDSGGAP